MNKHIVLITFLLLGIFSSISAFGADSTYYCLDKTGKLKASYTLHFSATDKVPYQNQFTCQLEEGVNMTKAVYKILRPNEYQSLVNLKYFSGSEHDKRDGFMHMSPQHQIKRIVNKYFNDVRPVYIAKITDKTFISKLIWEKASSGGTYPHLYDEVLWLSDIEEIQTWEKCECKASSDCPTSEKPYCQKTKTGAMCGTCIDYGAP